MRNQPTFLYATASFLAKWRLRNERRNSTLITCSLPISGECFWLVAQRGKFTSTNQEHYLDESSDTVISMEFLHLFLRRQFAAKPVMASREMSAVFSNKNFCVKKSAGKTSWDTKVPFQLFANTLWDAISHTIIAELRVALRAARGRSPIAKEMW